MTKSRVVGLFGCDGGKVACLQEISHMFPFTNDGVYDLHRMDLHAPVTLVDCFFSNFTSQPFEELSRSFGSTRANRRVLDFLFFAGSNSLKGKGKIASIEDKASDLPCRIAKSMLRKSPQTNRQDERKPIATTSRVFEPTAR